MFEGSCGTVHKGLVEWDRVRALRNEGLFRISSGSGSNKSLRETKLGAH